MRNEKNIDLYDSILSKICIPFEASEMSIHTVLLPVWAGGNSEIWRYKGEYFSMLENSAMQSIFKRWIRSGSLGN